ncbi:MAG: pilus assembly PilX N-terminal domain-containing protein [Thermodesulfobacteriota bacterium]|nr:pilus assembly PilX N-terminal domain-containing protein [Thermodesulfobacteriota bacterium]
MVILKNKREQTCHFHAHLLRENGSAVVIAMLVLVVLTIMGISAINLSTTESNILRNQQIYQINFYHTEDGNLNEGYKVGHSGTDWYKLKNPSLFDQQLLPDSGNYDPGTDMPLTGTFPDDFDEAKPESWPRQNLLDSSDDQDGQYDYAYFVKYLYSDNPPKGFDVSSFSGYKFRINSIREVEIETGGIKVGIKSGAF